MEDIIWITYKGRRIPIKPGMKGKFKKKKVDEIEKKKRDEYETKVYGSDVRKADKRMKEVFGEDFKYAEEIEKDKEDNEYKLYKQAKEKPDSIDPMTENSTDWEALDEKYNNKYNTELYNKWLKSQGIDKQLTEQEYNKMALETEKIINKGYERSIEMEKDNLARRKKNGDSVENISNMTHSIHDMELEKQKSDQRLAKLNRTNETLEDRVRRGIAGNQSDLVGKDREEQKAINKEYLKQSNIAKDKEETKKYNLKTSTYFGSNDLGEWEGKDFEDAKQNFLKENPEYSKGKYGNITGSEIKTQSISNLKSLSDYEQYYINQGYSKAAALKMAKQEIAKRKRK